MRTRLLGILCHESAPQLQAQTRRLRLRAPERCDHGFPRDVPLCQKPSLMPNDKASTLACLS